MIFHTHNNIRTNISPFRREVRKELNIFLVSINKKKLIMKKNTLF
jgi:hypothetical protein